MDKSGAEIAETMSNSSSRESVIAELFLQEIERFHAEIKSFKGAQFENCDEPHLFCGISLDF
jgi:hypothetical protein